MWTNRSFCRLCECPVVDGGVPASEIDLDKFDDWCLQSLGTKLADDLFEDDIFCNFCKWDAEQELSLSADTSSLDWWRNQVDLNKSGATLKSYYFDGIVTPCLVKLDKIVVPENEEKGETKEKLREEHYRNCIYCDKQMHKHVLKKHTEKFHKDIAIRCETLRCATYFHSLNERKIHMENVHEKPAERKMFPCVFCVKVFYKGDYYREHVKIMHIDAHRCTMLGCFSYFHTKDGLNSHFNLVPKRDKRAKIFYCEICNYKTSRKDSLEMHILLKHLEKTIKCEKCPKVFASKHVLKNHISQQHTFKACKLCQLKVPVGNFRHHFVERLCLRCKNKFPCSGKLQEHKKICNETVFQCKMCPKQFKLLCYFNYHLQVWHSERAIDFKYKELGFQCEECKKFYSSEYALNHHLKYVHENSGCVSCDQCPSHFTSIFGLKAHLAEKHDLIECKHKCLLCVKKFFHASSLKMHILQSHSTLANEYKNCQICGQSGKVLQLPKHMLKFHGIRA